MPRSNQNRSTSSNIAGISGLSQFQSGWLMSNRCRYHWPGVPSGSVVRVHAGPPKIEAQLLGGSSPSAPRPSRKTYRSRSGEPGAAARASLNHGCSQEEWFGTRSMSTRMPSSCALAMNASASASVPKSGEMS